MTQTSNLLISPSDNNSSLILNLGVSLGPEFHIVDVGRFVAIVHSSLGAAAVYPEANEAAAIKCAKALEAVLQKGGLSLPVTPFALSSTAVNPPVLIRSGPQAGTDILVGMSRASVNMKPLSAADLGKVIVLAGQSMQVEKGIDPNILEMLRASILRVVGNAKMYAGGPEIDVDELLMPQFLLPALLYSAAEHWTLPVVSQKGRGGFVMRMAYDESSVLMFKVTGLDVSSPLLFFLPVIDVVRKQKRGGEFVLDQCVERFGNFITDNLSSYLETSLEVRIATSA